MNPDTHEAIARRRRKISRSMREQTPDPKFVPNTRRRRFEDEEDEQLAGTTASEEANVQTIRMQIRPAGFMSAHQSKILRRRDKSFADSASRSHSQPRQAERLSSPEASDLLRNVKRSLSSPRNKEESSESELVTVPISVSRHLSPEPREANRQNITTRGRTSRSSSNGNAVTATPTAATADENLSRLELNLRRFEEERKRFEAEKRLFEREKREHKVRHKQLLDNEERKRLLQSYRKLSDHMALPTDAEERRRMVHSLRLNRNELPVPIRTPRMRNPVYDESSTQFSSSDAEADDITMATRLAKQMNPVRRHASAMTTRSPAQPPKPPERQRSSSRNNSLSPIRPQRRSKTPDTRYQNGVDEDIPKAQLSAPERNLTASTTELESEVDALRKRHVRKESLKLAEIKHRQSLEGQPIKMDNALEPTVVRDAPFDEPTTAASTQTAAPIGILERFFNILRPKEAIKDVKESTYKKALEDSKALQATESVEVAPTKTSTAVQQKIFSWTFLRLFYIDARKQWRCLHSDYPLEVAEYRRLRHKCIAHTIMLILLCGFGGLMFRYTEGTSEDIYKCEVRKVKRDFIDNLWTVSHNMREDDWKTLARQKLRKFEEELYALQLLGVLRYPGQHSWNFVNCILYCWTVVTTIGYGHITPKTTLGRSLTIIYAIIGIPMFLILLADFGKLFTRGMKFIWAYVRRLYYTGTCRQIRKQQQVRDAMSGFNTVYNFATRRPSYYFGGGAAGGGDADVESQSEAAKSIGASHPETPTSPYPETFEIDDEFNLPVSVATGLLIGYILFGTFVYTLWEDWTYFEAFYFVFISMSTIGFGDLVPKHPIFMMCSIVYLIFGLALTSMFINVVQIKLSDTFKQASAKIGATIGLGIASELGDEGGSQVKTPSDITSVHGSRLGKIAEDENESRRSPGSPQLTSILRPPRPVSPPPPTATPTQQNGQNEQNGQKEDFSDLEQMAPPLLPRRQVSMESSETEKKKKKRFFK